MAHLLRSSIFAFVFISSLAYADDFVCRLAENSTKSNDPSLILPSQVAASFGSDGQTVLKLLKVSRVAHIGSSYLSAKCRTH